MTEDRKELEKYQSLDDVKFIPTEPASNRVYGTTAVLHANAKPSSTSGTEPDDTTPLLPRTTDDCTVASHDKNENKNETSEKSTRSRSPASYLGLLFALLAAFSSSVINALVKALVAVDPAFISAFRFFFILLPTTAVVLQRRENVFPRGKRIVLVLRALLGAGGLITKYYALRYMPLADASVIILSSPVFVTIFARIFLKEACGVVNVLTVVGCLVGIVLIVRPPFMFGGLAETYNVIGPLLAISSCLLASNSYTTLRMLKDVHYSVTMFIFCIVSVPVSCAIWLAVQGANVSLPTEPVPWLILMAVGVLSYAVQYLFTRACQMEEAGPVAVVRTTDALFAVMWQLVWFHTVPEPLSIGGMVLVLLSVIAVALHKWWKSKVRQRSENAA